MRLRLRFGLGLRDNPCGLLIGVVVGRGLLGGRGRRGLSSRCRVWLWFRSRGSLHGGGDSRCWHTIFSELRLILVGQFDLLRP